MRGPLVITDATRRQLLHWGSAHLFGTWLTGAAWPGATSRAETTREPAAATTASASFGRAKRCIVLFMWGGPAHQDTWDMKPDAPAETRGDFQPIATRVPGIQVCEHFPRLAQRMDRLCLIRSMTHDNVDHTPSTHYLLTGEPPPRTTERGAQWPAIGSVLDAIGRGEGPLPPYVGMRPKLPNDVPRFVEHSQGQFGGWLGESYNPLTIDTDPSLDDYQVAEMRLLPGIDRSRLQHRRELLRALDQRLRGAGTLAAADLQARRAYELLTGPEIYRDAFRIDLEPEALRDKYGRNPHGQSVLQARRLLERGVPLVTVYWPNDGIKNVSVYWDTHRRNFVDLKSRLMPVADAAFSALLDDLQDRGMLDDTLVIWTGEFGRTPRVGQRSSDAGAGQDGRDHWSGCFTSVLAGGGARPGFVYGRSDARAAYPQENPVSPRDFIASVYHLLGVPADLQLPDATGRPRLVRPGNAIHELFA